MGVLTSSRQRNILAVISDTMSPGILSGGFFVYASNPQPNIRPTNVRPIPVIEAAFPFLNPLPASAIPAGTGATWQSPRQAPVWGSSCRLPFNNKPKGNQK